MNVEISREVVTPSSPTPQHLKKYNLSCFDQTFPHVLMPLVLFYIPNNNNTARNCSNSERSKQLKRSLSQTLTLFYPLAGRYVHNNNSNSYVNCNDKGVTYIEAEANFKLCDVITDPINMEELSKFIPCNPYEATTDVCMIVQATFFSCGGLAIGFGMSHKIADAFSNIMFVNRWAAISSHANIHDIQQPPPIFEAAALFPPRTRRSPMLVTSTSEKEEEEEIFDKLVKKRFVFTAQRIADLRDKYTSSKNDFHVRPTTVEALSTFIWTRFMVATGAKDDASKVYVLRFPVDIRKRMVPSLSEYHFGNIILHAITTAPSLDGDVEDAAGYGIVKKIRDAISHIDKNYIAEKIHEDDENNKPKEKRLEGGKKVEFRFSGLHRLHMYKADFGWGSPVWVASGKTTKNPVVHFMPTLSGDGVEAVVNLKEEHMILFQADKELLRYVYSC